MIKNINHINIASDNVAANIHFYCDLLGLIHGKDISNGMGGHYLYADGNPEPLIHLMDTNKVAAKEQGRTFILVAKAATKGHSEQITGSIDHVAFSLTKDEFDIYKKRLQDAGLDFIVPLDG